MPRKIKKAKVRITVQASTETEIITQQTIIESVYIQNGFILDWGRILPESSNIGFRVYGVVRK